ncbi:MAG: hypothetical protein K2V38_26700, partial [Gemmataceae bacterium]|nr:hypothetical protein [Gemmataceae bacterium]
KSGDLAKLRHQRAIANTFMSVAADRTGMALRDYADKQGPRLSEEGKQMSRQAQEAEFWLAQTGGRPELLDAPLPGNRTPRQVLRQAEQFIAFMIESPNSRSEDKDAARAYYALLQLTQHRLASLDGDRSRDQLHYFLNAPNRTDKDAVEFLLWEKKADQLGIRFTPEDVQALLNRELHDFYRSSTQVEVQNIIRERGLNLNACLQALAVEFKVRTAQVALLGPVAKMRANSAPTLGLPYEALEYYRRQCNPATFELLAVPAAAFLGKVPGEPTREELRELFDKHKSQEPNPARDTPGFMEPRKLSVHWLSVTGEEPYYKALAAEQLRAAEGAFKGIPPLPVSGGGWESLAPLAIKEPVLDAAY